jgi:hypothetical protein
MIVKLCLGLDTVQKATELSKDELQDILKENQYPFTPLCSIPHKRLPSLTVIPAKAGIQKVPVHAPIQYTL